MKKLGIFLAVVIVAVGGGMLYLHSNLDGMVKDAIEKYGTAATQSDVRVSHVKLSLTSGEGSLSELNVANPKGFSGGKALTLAGITVKLDTNSLTGSGPIVIREITVDKPHVLYEATERGDSNLQALERNLAGSSPAPASGSKKEPERKFIINDFIIRDGQIGIDHPLLPQSMNAPLPVIHLTNIGKDKGGATPSQIAKQVLTAISNNAVNVAGDVLTRNINTGTLKNIATGASGGIAKRVNGLGSLLGK